MRSVANFDYVAGVKLSSTYQKYKSLGYLESPDPINDDEEEKANVNESGKRFITFYQTFEKVAF